MKTFATFALIAVLLGVTLFGCLNSTSQPRTAANLTLNNASDSIASTGALPAQDVDQVGDDVLNISDDLGQVDVNDTEIAQVIG